MPRINITKTDLISTFVCAGFFTAWITATAKHFSPFVFALLTLLCVNYLLLGCLIINLISNSYRRLNEFPIKFLFGYLAFNSSIFFLCAVIGLSIKVSFYGLCGIIFIVTIMNLSRLPASVPNEVSENSLAILLCVIIALLGTTLWSQDSFNPIIFNGDSVIITPWRDSFYHAVLTRVIANGVPMQNPSFSGVSAPIYHYASYMVPALLTATTEVSCFQAFNALQVPMGLFLATIAAYALVCSWWGSWPGLAASIGLILIPSACYHGIFNHWFSYHWLMLISPSLSYGIVIITLSWILVFESINLNRLTLIVIAYLIAAISVFYKAHIFVANALILPVYPFLFWRHIRLKVRLSGIALFAALFYVTIKLSQQFKSVPFISCDFSAFNQYLGLVISMIENARVKHFLSDRILIQHWYSLPLSFLLIFYSTFGLFGLMYAPLAFILRKDILKEILLFPLSMIIVYLIMSVGLAYDRNMIGTPEELLHRPFVWAYFIVCSWTMGAFYLWILGNNPPKRGFLQFVMSIVIIALCLVSAYLGSEVQMGPPWGKTHSWTSVPAGLVQSSLFIRDNSKKEDILQDSKGDPTYMISALSERQPFFIDSNHPRIRKLPQYSDRLPEVRRLKAFTTREEVASFVSANRIKWYILHPDDIVLWPKELVDNPVFEKDGFRVYKFE
jgi:hypothetical protein